MIEATRDATGTYFHNPCGILRDLGSYRRVRTAFPRCEWWVSFSACRRQSDGQDLQECFTDSIKRLRFHQLDPVGKAGLVYCPQLVTNGHRVLSHAQNPHGDRWVRCTAGRRQRDYQDSSSRSIDRGGGHQDAGAYLLDFRALRWIEINPPDVASPKLSSFHQSIPSPRVTSQSFISAPSVSSCSTVKAAR